MIQNKLNLNMFALGESKLVFNIVLAHFLSLTNYFLSKTKKISYVSELENTKIKLQSKQICLYVMSKAYNETKALICTKQGIKKNFYSSLSALLLDVQKISL